MSEVKMNEGETKTAEQVLCEENAELQGKLKEANDKCDMWFATLSLADKIELMARYYQLRERSRFIVCDKEMIHVWDNAGAKNCFSGEVES